jgi:hypothetical protein
MSSPFLTEAQRLALAANGLRAARDDGFDPDRAFGLCDLGLGCPELGYVSLSELAGVRGRLGLPVECDRHFRAGRPLSAYAAEAQAVGRVLS